MNRRVFLSSAAAAGAVAGLEPLSGSRPVLAATTRPAAGASAGTAANRLLPAPAPGAGLSRAMLARLEGSRFRVEGMTGRELELAALREGPRSRGLEQFFVMFRDVSSGPRLPGGLYSLAHPRQGVIQLYLEPVTDDPRGPCYRAALCLLA